jgi:hypothetical protein
VNAAKQPLKRVHKRRTLAKISREGHLSSTGVARYTVSAGVHVFHATLVVATGSRLHVDGDGRVIMQRQG